MTLTVTAGTGLVSLNAGAAASTVTYSSTIDAVTDALATLTYQPQGPFSDSITVTGKLMGDTQQLIVPVSVVPLSLTLTPPAAFTAYEGTNVTFSVGLTSGCAWLCAEL